MEIRKGTEVVKAGMPTTVQLESINAGTSGNVIPAQAIFTFHCDADKALIAQVAENTAIPYRCTVEL